MSERSESKLVCAESPGTAMAAIVVLKPGPSGLRVSSLTVLDRLLVSIYRAGWSAITVVCDGPLPEVSRARALGIPFSVVPDMPAIEGRTLVVRGEVLVQVVDLKRLAATGGRLVESGIGAGANLADHGPGTPGGGTAPSTDARFMESPLFKNDLLTGHEPGEAEGRLRRRLRGESRFMESGVGASAAPTDHEPGKTPWGEAPPSAAGGTATGTEGGIRGMGGKVFPVGVLSGSMGDWESELADQSGVVAEGIALWVRDAEEARAAGRALWASLKSSSDGWVDRVFNRPVGRPLAKGLSRTWVTPNQISVASILLGVISGVLFGFGQYGWAIAGAVLFQVSAVLDCVDGDVARIVFKESPLGKWLDLIGDQVVHVSVFAGIAVGLFREGSDAPVGFLGVAAIVGALVSFGMVVRGMKRSAGGASDEVLGRFLDAATNRDFSVLVFALACGDLLEIFLWLAAIGSHVFWVLLWWLQGRSALAVRGGA